MANFDVQNSDSILNSISGQIAADASGLLALSEGDEIELGEVISLWFVPAVDISPTAEVDEVAIELSRVHVQMYRDGDPFAFARVTVGATGSFKVTEMFESKLAATIQDVILTVDKDRAYTDFSARLLSIPGFRAEALWLHSETEDVFFPLIGVLAEGIAAISWRTYIEALVENGLEVGIEE